MNTSNDRLPGGVSHGTIWISMALMLLTLVLTACGGGVGTSAEPEPPVVAACVPSDPSTAAECGTVIIGLTDADGDFLSYTVDVLSLDTRERQRNSDRRSAEWDQDRFLPVRRPD